jgi:type II secretory ATPase GspE/PulE/Tfp pilus assembly ATPase PilB-like protein
MIGEMRDQETASTALEAALTGHLVFSTLHTNNAAETITRLFDMGFNPIYFADALLGVLAQRLVRKICQNCKDAYHPSEQEKKEIISEYGEDDFNASGIELKSDLVLYRSRGCEECSGVGYSGRLAIHELLENTIEIKNLIKQKEITEKIANTAMKSGMTTLKQDGILKVLGGITDLSEVRRVCIK